ncbi:MAG TPA: hypothetical protein VFY71_05780 [Planctomycetota bacterium]|nr:hypothetical protein [Planctomycetota bacterium]
MDEWKLADNVVTGRLLAEFMDCESPARIQVRYFGSPARASEVLDKCRGLQPGACLLEWAMADFRTSPKAKTFLERRLEQPSTTPVERALIQARLDARLSIYRVLAVHAKVSLDLEDILSGERTTLQERSLSTCDIGHCFLPLRLTRVGSWDFCAFAGPPLTSFTVGPALELLQRRGADLSSGGLRRKAHLVGRLWEFALPGHEHLPRLHNTDGDPMEFQKATFRMADSAAAQHALEAREDVVRDEELWVWQRPGGPVPGFGETTLLGRIELLGDRLVLEVNSVRRLLAARRWIERLPGVRFETATARALDAERPLDDTLAGK